MRTCSLLQVAAQQETLQHQAEHVRGVEVRTSDFSCPLCCSHGCRQCLCNIATVFTTSMGLAHCPDFQATSNEPYIAALQQAAVRAAEQRAADLKEAGAAAAAHADATAAEAARAGQVIEKLSVRCSNGLACWV